jgi:putative N6-adenine-specific DNA methylase
MNQAVEFFLVTLPGLEDLVLAEVGDWFPHLECKVEYGGLTVFAPLAEGLAMNQVLKTPTRILVRVTRFMCKDFPKLYNRLVSLPWQNWVQPGSAVEVHAASKRSRLKIKTRIEETATEAWQASQKKQSKTADGPLRLYLRLVDNECTVSLDTSGERLHKRGARVHIGEAPLRETIAASLLQMVGRTVKDPRPVELVDPMLGSGTFLLEALTRDLPVDRRQFAFEAFASQPMSTPVLGAARPQFESLIGYEMDGKTLQAAKANLAKLRSTSCRLIAEDFFAAKALPKTPERQRWVIANPPYGERLHVEGDLSEFYQRLFASAERVAEPDRACFLLPAKVVKGKFILPPAWKVLEKRRFLNGGIPVVAFVFGRF